MAAIDEKLVARVVGEVLTRLSTQPSASAAKTALLEIPEYVLDRTS